MTLNTAAAGIDPAQYPHIDFSAISSRKGFEGKPRYVVTSRGEVGDTDTDLFVPTRPGAATVEVAKADIASAAQEQVSIMWDD